MGAMYIDVFNVSTGTWTTVDSILGQTHTDFASADPWIQRGVSLTAFCWRYDKYCV